MKKIVSLVVVLLLLTTLIGCGNNQEPAESSVAPDATEQPQEEVAKSPLADPRVRQAIMYAIDMEAINESLFDGMAIPANSLTPGGEWKPDGLNDYAYDPEKARQLLAEADWDENYVLDVVFYYGDQITIDLMTAIQAYLTDVGMKMEFRMLEGDLAAQLWTPPGDPVNGPSEIDWDLAYAGCAASTLHDYYNRFQTGNASNSHTPSDPVLDELISATNATANVEEQKAAFFEVIKYENENMFSIPLYYQPVYNVESDRLDRGDAPYGNDTYNYDWDILNWDITPDSDGKKVLHTNSGAMEFFETPFINPGFFMYNKMLYDRLILVDESLEPIGGQLASDYSVSEDYMTVEFTLRDDVKWHDGDLLTAEDIKWTYEFASKVPTMHVVMASTFASLEGYQEYVDGEADEISGIVVDGNTITFHFSKIDPNSMFTFSQLPALPQKYFADVDPLNAQQAEYWQSPVGTGPFKIKEVSMNDYTILERFDDYYGGQAKIDEVYMYPSGESDANLVKNASAGMVDYAFTKSVEDVMNLQGIDGIKVTPVITNYTRMFFVNKFLKPE